MHDTETEHRTQKHGGTTWVDLENPTKEVLVNLEHTYSLDPVHVRETTQKAQHIEVERQSQYLFLVLHVPVLTTHTDKIHLTQVGVFLGKDFLLTIRDGASPCITDLFEVCNLSPVKAEEFFKEGSGYLLYRLINSLLGDISEMTDEVYNELDALEDLVFDAKDSDIHRIGKLRQKIVRLSRVIGPKRLLLDDLAEQVNSFIGSHITKYYLSNVKLVNKLWEEVEEAKETVEVYKDADFTTSTEQTNRILAILTLVFTFTIPISVVGTLYGMNVPMPGALTEKVWRFWGPYTTAFIAITISTILAFLMHMYFKRKKWY